MADITSEIRSSRLRVRLPGNNSQPGTAGQALTVLGGPPTDDEPKTNVLFAKEWFLDDDCCNVSDSFSFTVSNVRGEANSFFYEGQRVEVDESDPDVANGAWCRQFTGRVVDISDGSDASGGSVVVVTCMDLGWHLTSCPATPQLKLTGITMQQLLAGYVKRGKQKPGLIDPTWGFATTATGGPSVTFGNALNTKLKQGRTGAQRAFAQKNNPFVVLPYIQVEPGQTPWEVLQPYAKREGVLVNVGAQGDVILFRPDYGDESPYNAIQYHDASDSRNVNNNVVGRPMLRRQVDGFFSESQCWSTVVNPTFDQQTQIANNPNLQYRREKYVPAQNPLPFTRLNVIVDSEAITSAMRQNRAIWGYQFGIFNSWSYDVEVRGHASGGVFWTSNALVSLIDSVRGLDATYYIQRVRRSSSTREGDRTKILLRMTGLLDPSLQAQIGGGAKKASQVRGAVK